MKKKDLAFFERELKEKIIDQEERLAKSRKRAQEDMGPEAAGEASTYTYHMADQGTDAREKEKAFYFASRDEKYLQQLYKAMDRIKEGTFGICRVCGEDIPFDRLKAVPTTTICYDCKQKESASD
jgi:RNA polymerase-binding protein DksA